MKKKTEKEESHAAPKVAGGAKGKKKAASKSAAKAQKVAGKKSVDSAREAKKTIEKVLKYTPSKGKTAETPKKVGKVSTKRSVSKKTPAMASPSQGSKDLKTTDQMTMAQFKKYLDWHEKKKGGR